MMDYLLAQALREVDSITPGSAPVAPPQERDLKAEAMRKMARELGWREDDIAWEWIAPSGKRYPRLAMSVAVLRSEIGGSP